MYDDPRILRVIVPHAIRLEKDPEGYDDDEIRTSDDIESHFILPKSKKELTVEQLSEINLSLDIKLSKTNNRCLRKLIYKKIIKPRKKDSSLIADSLDFKKEQQAVIDTELKKISQSIDLSRLKEGDTISLSLD
jgi:hypothetical protein